MVYQKKFTLHITKFLKCVSHQLHVVRVVEYDLEKSTKLIGRFEDTEKPTKLGLI